MSEIHQNVWPRSPTAPGTEYEGKSENSATDPKLTRSGAPLIRLKRPWLLGQENRDLQQLNKLMTREGHIRWTGLNPQPSRRSVADCTRASKCESTKYLAVTHRTSIEVNAVKDESEIILASWYSLEGGNRSSVLDANAQTRTEN